MKLNFEKIEVNYVDIELMKIFIEYYEDSQKYINEYNELCKNIRTKLKISKEKSVIDELNNRINDNLIEKSHITDKNKYKKLEQEYQELMENYNKIKQYKKIIEINRKFDETTIGQLQKTKQDEYKKFEKQKSGIRVIYINIKYLYQIYRSIFEYNINKKEPNFIKKLKLKQALKQIKPITIENEYNFANIEDIEKNIKFFNTYSETIAHFNESEGPKIIDAINETQKEETIKIDKNITIITNPKRTSNVLQEEQNYTKTKSA